MEFITAIGGIEVRHGAALGKDVTLDDLRRDYDAVFLGMGVGHTNKLGLADGGQIEASFSKGLLTVTFPKSAEAQKSAKTIAVKAA